VGQWVINKTFNAAMLAEALCMLEGFIYAPAIRLLQHGVQQSGISSM
jgi:adenine-specific DNA-methyltransferase